MPRHAAQARFVAHNQAAANRAQCATASRARRSSLSNRFSSFGARSSLGGFRRAQAAKPGGSGRNLQVERL